MIGIQKLSENSARLLTSGNIITSIFSAVKELVENAIDSEATNVEVRLENSGLDKIEVKDNGCGIKQIDINNVAKAHYTSKISSHLDLNTLETYGFRGEALNALCSISLLSVTTKTINDDISQTYSFNKIGDVVLSKPSSSLCGTTVTVQHLFKDIPVRKKYYKSQKHKREELKKIEDLLCTYSCAQIGTRFALFHNKNLVWQKSPAPCIKPVLIQIFGNSIVNLMDYKTVTLSQDIDIKIDAFLPKATAPVLSVTRTTNDKCIIIINKRPVMVKAIIKMIQEIYCQSVNEEQMKDRFPFCLLNISVPSFKIDVNVDPNKSQVLLHDFEKILEVLSEFLQSSFSKGSLENREPKICSIETVMNQKSISDVELISKSISNPLKPDNVFDLNEETKEKGKNHVENISPNNQQNQSTSYHSESNTTADLLIRSSPNKDITIQNKNSHKQQRMQNSHLVKNLNGEMQMNLKSFNQSKKIALHKVTQNFKSLETSNNQSLFQSQLCFDVESDIPKSNSSAVNSGNSDSIAKSMITTITKVNSKSDDFVQISSKHCVNSVNNTSNPISYLSTLNVAQQNELPNLSLNSQNQSNIANSNTEVTFSNNLKLLHGKELSVSPTSPNKTYEELQGQVANSIFIQPSNDNTKKSYMMLNNIPASEFSKMIKNNQTNINMDSNWQHGRMINSAGKHLQPVTVLTPSSPKRANFDEISPSEKNKKQKFTKQVERNAIKPLSGFEYFCVSTRLEVQAANPDSNNQEVAQILYDEWKKLPQEKQHHFKELATKQYSKTVKSKKQLSNTLSQALKKSKRDKDLNVLPGKFKFKTKEMEICFNVPSLRKANTGSSKLIINDRDHVYNSMPISALSNGVWLCLKEQHIVLLNSCRIKEMLIYTRLLNTYKLQADLLDVPINLCLDAVLGLEYSQILLTMVHENINFVSHPALTTNGFNIHVVQNDTDISFKVVGIATCIPSYGIYDLQEILQILKSKGLSLPLADYRPGKVKHYLQSETVRICRQSLTIQSTQELIDLLKQSKNYLPSNITQCFHGKPFEHSLLNISTLK